LLRNLAITFTRTLRRFSQLLILFGREFEPYTAALPPDCLFKLLLAGDVQREASVLCHFPYLLVVLEHDLARERCFQILFQELAEPALPEHEVHIHALLVGASATVAEALTSTVRRR
jgi:hypothetical protein